jgi:hypothetical protein
VQRAEIEKKMQAKKKERKFVLSAKAKIKTKDDGKIEAE